MPRAKKEAVPAPCQKQLSFELQPMVESTLTVTERRCIRRQTMTLIRFSSLQNRRNVAYGERAEPGKICQGMPKPANAK